MSEEESEMTCRRRRRRVCLQEEEKQGVVERGDGAGGREEVVGKVWMGVRVGYKGARLLR